MLWKWPSANILLFCYAACTFIMFECVLMSTFNVITERILLWLFLFPLKMQFFSFVWLFGFDFNLIILLPNVSKSIFRTCCLFRFGLYLIFLFSVFLVITFRMWELTRCAQGFMIIATSPKIEFARLFSISLKFYGFVHGGSNHQYYLVYHTPIHIR